MSDLLWIMRHGEAAPGFPDHERELTERGRQEVARMAQWLACQLDHLNVPRVVASPYRRAQQTAAIIARRLGTPVTTLDCITPDDAIETAIEWLQGQATQTPMLLVSHMPWVGVMTSRLTEGERAHGIGFPTAAIARLEAEVWAPGCATLREFQTPGSLG
ncbi:MULTISPECIES: phosphohistidine phosphatase SixA [Halomonadaceae]|uniref:phosphohistidine phosphatase SixA n=1 Tax=Halomonadaceae TaxID=28256 RepID=UPI00159ACD4D|nr:MULTISPECIES: phosphohistidine phosphatase SixA [Halomonas]QJQ95337.1 phosphohistidine phosphatase SixA [Halomonas sp. PA5]